VSLWACVSVRMYVGVFLCTCVRVNACEIISPARIRTTHVCSPTCMFLLHCVYVSPSVPPLRKSGAPWWGSTECDCDCGCVPGRSGSGHVDVMRPPTPQTLDLSFNGLGGGSGAPGARRGAVQALASVLSVNVTLRHLDLSNNNLSTADGAVLAKGLAPNSTLRCVASVWFMWCASCAHGAACACVRLCVPVCVPVSAPCPGS
jgi:hypothetical protein